MLKTSAFQVFHRGYSAFMNSFDKTNFLCKIYFPISSALTTIQHINSTFANLFKVLVLVASLITVQSIQPRSQGLSSLPPLVVGAALLNLPLTSLNEVTTVTSSTNKYDAPQTSPANSLYKPKISTKPNEYHS